MPHCWEEYLWKVHKAVPVDPWASNVQLLDVMIAEKPPSLLFPPWLVKRKLLPHALSRAGSMFSLAGEHSYKPKAVVATASANDGISNNEPPIQQLDINVAGGDTSLVPQVDNNNRGSTHHGPSAINIANGDSADKRQPQITDGINGSLSTHSLRKDTISGPLLPHVSDASNDVKHQAQLTKGGCVNQVLNKSKNPNGDTAIPMHVINNMINGKLPRAQANHIRKYSHSSAEPKLKTLSIRASRMPDLQASIKSSISLLASITGGSSASAQFNAKGSKTVTCNVGGVESQSVDLDALEELVTPRMTFDDCLVAPWQPDISLPQLQACPKRGQTLWVVTEILYANVIKIDGDNQAQATSKAKVVKGVEGVEVSEQVGVEKESLWKVTTAKDNRTFPFALRLQRLKYDANGSLVTSSNKYLKRNNSLSIQNQ